MTYQQLLNTISVAGSVLSAIGVGVALWQLRKTRHAAEAAERASRQAQAGIARNVMLVDVTACVSQLDAIKGMIRSQRFEAALIRVGDLTASFVQLREVAPSDQRPPLSFKKALTQLAILTDLLERRLIDGKTDVDIVQINSVLTQLSVALNGWIGNTKYLAPEDQSNG